MAHPELKSGRLEFLAVSTDDPAVFAFLRLIKRVSRGSVLSYCHFDLLGKVLDV